MWITRLSEHLICLPPFMHAPPFNPHHRPGKCVLLFPFYRKENRLREVLCQWFQVTQLVRGRTGFSRRCKWLRDPKHFSLWLSISDLRVGVSFITWQERAWVVTYSLCRSESWNTKHLNIIPKMPLSLWFSTLHVMDDKQISSLSLWYKFPTLSLTLILNLWPLTLSRFASPVNDISFHGLIPNLRFPKPSPLYKFLTT